MTIEGAPSLPPASTTIVYADQKSGGPRVFGALAMLFGGMGVIGSLLEIGSAGDTIDLFSADQTSYSFWFYVDPILGIASAALFAYAGFLLWNYKKKGVWMGLGAVGINTVNGVLGSIIIGMITEEVGEEAGLDGFGAIITSGGLFLTAIGAVCCGLIVLLPLFMNGNDLDDE